MLQLSYYACMQLYFNFLIRIFFTFRKDIMDAYAEEKKKALDYMAATKSRVAITTDLWTSENQKRGYMAVTAHLLIIHGYLETL